MSEGVQVLQSALFKRAYKRLHPNEKADVDDARAEIVNNPALGEAKKESLRTSLNAMDSLPCWLMNMMLQPACCFCSVPTKIFIEV